MATSPGGPRQDCDFCDLDGFRVNSEVLLENGLCLYAAGDRTDREALRGSGIIVPKAHRETVFDLTPDEFAATGELLRAARDRLADRYAPDGFTVGWNCYPSAGQVVAHAHLHVIPRFADEPHAGRGLRAALLRGDDQPRRRAR